MPFLLYDSNMDRLSTDFLLLAAPDGAFTTMLSSMKTIRAILRNAELTPDEEKIYGHCGIPGEYIHGIDFARMRLERLNGEIHEKGLHACIAQLFESRTKSSQLSSQLQQTGVYGFKESAFDALFRAVNTAQCLLDDRNNRLTDDDKIILRGAIEQFSKGLYAVKTYMEENGQSYIEKSMHLASPVADINPPPLP